MALRLEILGFAGAAPLQGACSSYLVASEEATVLLDCGPGTLERLWRRDLLGRLDAIVVSHMHADHVLDLVGLAGEVAGALRGGRPLALHVPGEHGRAVLARLDGAFAAPGEAPAARTRFDEAFAVACYAAGDRLVVGDLTITFAPTAHAQPCFAARVTDGRSVLVYGADGAPSDALVALAADADLLLLEATFADDEARAESHGHMTAGQAGATATLAGARRLVLTHQLAGTPEGALVGAAEQAFSGPVRLAHERYRVEL
jgi:ribonuclease BN (tRNA processing enzyme)